MMDLESKPDRCAVPFPLLADPDNYVACKLDLGGDHDSRAYWIGLFRRHLKLLIAEASRQYRDDPKIDDRTVIIDREFGAYLDAVTETPDRFGRLDIITICRAREAAMRKAGIDDAYYDAKENENEAALRLLANLLDDLDTASETERPLSSQATSSTWAPRIPSSFSPTVPWTSTRRWQSCGRDRG